MKIALAQLNPTIGDIPGNCSLIGDLIDQAKSRKADLVVFPELAIAGYPPKDLLLKPAFINRCEQAIETLAFKCQGIAAIIGHPRHSNQNPCQGRRALYNAAAFCHQGKVQQIHIKSLLPTYDVFDEMRYFEPPPAQKAYLPIVYLGIKIGITICEDLWNDQQLLGQKRYQGDPVGQLVASQVQLMINCSASPFELGKQDLRIKLFSKIAQTHELPLVYCNQVGGQDELVFDGQSLVFDAKGQTLAQAKAFEQDLLLVDVPVGQTSSTGQAVHQATQIKSLEPIESVCRALVLGLRDYAQKCGFKSIVLGLSGGIDSAVTAALAVAAVGEKNVSGIAMPSRFSSAGSVDDAQQLAKNLGIHLDHVPIEPAHKAMENMLKTHFAGKEPDATEENIQARLRGLILMAFSNKNGALLVTTGNKSELAVGYCTLYGDMCGGMAILSDVPKTMVWQLARWINESPNSPLYKQYQLAVIPPSSINKAPSAELRADQTDQDALPAYDILDRIVQLYVQEDASASQIAKQMPDTSPEVITRMLRLIDLNEYKRKQAAPGIKVTSRAFGFGRRMPMAQRYQNNDVTHPK